MAYVEEREFTLRFELRCEFPDDYDGDADGYEWVKELAPVLGELVRTSASVLQARPGLKIRTSNRGRPSDEEVTFIVEKRA
jgi:hypothetical protein